MQIGFITIIIGGSFIFIIRYFKNKISSIKKTKGKLIRIN